MDNILNLIIVLMFCILDFSIDNINNRKKNPSTLVTTKEWLDTNQDLTKW